MKTLIIINTVINVFLLARLAIKYNRLKIEWSKTFHCKNKLSLEFWWYKYPIKSTSNKGYRFLNVPIRTNKKRLELEDSDFKRSRF